MALLRPQVELLEVDEVDKHVKEVLLSKVCRWTSSQVAWWHDGAATVFSTYYSHMSYVLSLCGAMLRYSCQSRAL